MGRNVDEKATTDAIVEAAKNPLSVIIVAVGDKLSTEMLERMDGDRGDLYHSITGEKAQRDIVQAI